MQIKHSTSPSYSILTPGRLVPALTRQRQAPGIDINSARYGKNKGKTDRQDDRNRGKGDTERAGEVVKMRDGQNYRKKRRKTDACWLLACLTSKQHATVSDGRVCLDNVTCYHTDIHATDETFYLTQSQYTDTGPIQAKPVRVATGVSVFKSLVLLDPEISQWRQRESKPGSSAPEAVEKGRFNH